MSVTIRDVPEAVRDELAGRAPRNGQSLQVCLRVMLEASAARPSASDVVARARARVIASGTTLSTAAILSARDADRR